MRRATQVSPDTSSTQCLSIHALLAESDLYYFARLLCLLTFYPRSPCGERRCWRCNGQSVGRTFYPRSPCGERPESIGTLRTVKVLSIHALLAESDNCFSVPYWFKVTLSIHALLAESDCLLMKSWPKSWQLSIHALLAESDTRTQSQSLSA